jgi:kinesin family protein 18/19
MDAPSVISVDDDENEGVYSIDVAVRVRPLNHMETNEVNCIRVMEGGIVVILDPQKMEGGHQEEDYLRQNRSREKRYAFDHAFDETASQHDLYMATTEKLLGGIMDGFNASCFAYGATGAGKTHTMLGNTEHPGCMVLTVGELFKRITSNDNKVWRVYLTYLEVYNENIRDLLNPSTGYLDLREDPVKGVCVAGITEFTTSTAEDTMQLLHRGNLNRSVEPTKKNETSSRSHAVMQIMVEGKDKASGLSETVRIGKLSMIDLAGSERASATDNRGARLVEGANINRSLLALANCINALGTKFTHFPGTKVQILTQKALLASESEAAARAGRRGHRRVRANFVPYRYPSGLRPHASSVGALTLVADGLIHQ